MVELRSMLLPGAERPTMKALLAHWRQYGLSEKPGYRGKVARYGSYKKLAKDPLIEVAFDYLGEQSYVQLIEAVGYGEFVEDARADWVQAREETS